MSAFGMPLPEAFVRDTFRQGKPLPTKDEEKGNVGGNFRRHGDPPDFPPLPLAGTPDTCTIVVDDSDEALSKRTVQASSILRGSKGRVASPGASDGGEFGEGGTAAPQGDNQVVADEDQDLRKLAVLSIPSQGERDEEEDMPEAEKQRQNPADTAGGHKQVSVCARRRSSDCRRVEDHVPVSNSHTPRIPLSRFPTHLSRDISQ